MCADIIFALLSLATLCELLHHNLTIIKMPIVAFFFITRLDNFVPPMIIFSLSPICSDTFASYNDSNSRRSLSDLMDILISVGLRGSSPLYK